MKIIWFAVNGYRPWSMMRLLGLCIALSLPVALAEAQPAAPTGIDAAPYREGLSAGGQVYQFDPQHSQLLLYTFKGGFLSAFGHNHVLALREIQGLALLAGDSRASRADLVIPIAAIEVDNSALREAAGDDFDSLPSASDIAGTRDNMLSSAQLDGGRFPEIRVVVRVRQWQPPRALLQLSLQIRGRTIELTVPAQVGLDGETLTVSAELELSQAELGITPFSALGGTLKVADSVKLSVRLLAYQWDES